MRTQAGVLIIATAPASGGHHIGLMLSGGTVSGRTSVELTREEAAELGRQLVTVAYGHRVILVQEGMVIHAV